MYKVEDDEALGKLYKVFHAIWVFSPASEKDIFAKAAKLELSAWLELDDMFIPLEVFCTEGFDETMLYAKIMTHHGIVWAQREAIFSRADFRF